MRVKFGRCVVRIIAVMLLFLCTQQVFAQQLELFTTQPIVDSFPVVRIGFALTNNSGPAQPLTPANFTITEDGSPVTPIQLLNCSGFNSAAVAVVSDISSSVYSSAGNGNFGPYFNSYSQLIAQLTSPSQLALITFNDHVTGYSPGPNRANGFYLAANQIDTTEFMDSVRNVQFGGNTDIDTALVFAAGVLSKSALQRKVIVLITDDAVNDDPRMYNLLQANNISLFVMELLKDTVWQNADLASALQGGYYAAGDSTNYVNDMTEIGRGILGEECLLRYTSTLPCPWEKHHKVNIGVSFGGGNTTAQLGYALGDNKVDTIPPNIAITTPVYTSRLVKAQQTFPCLPGIASFTDSALVNFAKLKQPRAFPDSASDSLVVIDSLLPASGYYLAKDSLGNVRKILLTYFPKPDTTPPQLPLALLISGKYLQNVTEERPWDRGLKSIQLLPGARNLVLDSVHYFSKTFAQAYLHIPILLDSASGCLEAIDSVGNSNTYCYRWNGEGGDTLPPVFAQDPIAEPRTILSGIVTELRKGDVGLASVVLTPVLNTTLQTVAYTSKALASIRANLIDSLYPALCAVEALDSAGNRMRDTLRYQPVPDVLPPQVTITSPTKSTFLATATEIRSWDRGIMILSTFGAMTNITTAPPVFADSRHASILLTVTDPTITASATIIAEDSAGNALLQPLSYSPNAIAPLLPLQVTTPVDFGTIAAGTLRTKQVTVTNPNPVPVTLTKVAATGDDSEFSWKEIPPVTINASATANLNFTFTPKPVGLWRASYVMNSDTMQLLEVALIGRSTGTLHLSVDTLALQKGGDRGTLNLRMDATPEPINLDTILFTLQSDRDIAMLGSFSQTCSGLDTGMCNYTVTSTQDANGNYRYQFIRINAGLAPTLQSSIVHFAIPVTSFVGPANSTPVLFSQASAGEYCMVTEDTGLVTMGNSCADQTLRATLNDQLPVYLQSVTPNPAHGVVQAKIISTIQGQRLSYVLLNALGQSEKQGELTVGSGVSIVPIDVSQLTSGNYLLQLTANGKSCGNEKIEIVR